jgi:hypothetical protein
MNGERSDLRFIGGGHRGAADVARALQTSGDRSLGHPAPATRVTNSFGEPVDYGGKHRKLARMAKLEGVDDVPRTADLGGRFGAQRLRPRQ